MLRTVVTYCCLLLLLAPVAAEQNVNPDINRHYEDPDVSQWRGVFERDGREVWDRRNDIIRHLHLQPEQTVADLGAGSGFFTLLMAQQVGQAGRVFAVDIAKNFVDAIVQRAAGQGLNNVVGIVNSQRSTGLSAASVDLIFISDTYHHFEYPQAMLASIHHALKPSGELVVIDFRRASDTSSAWVLSHVRTDAQQVIEEIQNAGFELSENLDFMQGQYFLRFRRK